MINIIKYVFVFKQCKNFSILRFFISSHLLYNTFFLSLPKYKIINLKNNRIKYQITF